MSRPPSGTSLLSRPASDSQLKRGYGSRPPSGQDQENVMPNIPDNIQVRKLKGLNEEVGRVGSTFNEAQRAREAHQRLLNEMVEETLRIIGKTRGHGLQMCKHVKGSTKSYATMFQHDMQALQENYRHELGDRCNRVERTFDGLNDRMGDLEDALDHQREVRKKLIEEQLGPIRDEEKRILATIELERRARRLEEERRTTMLQDEIEEIVVLIDKEKFQRDLQSTTFDRMAPIEQHKVEKRMYQAEKERDKAWQEIKEEIQEETKERIEKQHGVVESVAAFVGRYRGQVLKELEVQNCTIKEQGSLLSHH